LTPYYQTWKVWRHWSKAGSLWYILGKSKLDDSDTSCQPHLWVWH